jgi:hypothetical protein
MRWRSVLLQQWNLERIVAQVYGEIWDYARAEDLVDRLDSMLLDPRRLLRNRCALLTILLH